VSSLTLIQPNTHHDSGAVKGALERCFRDHGVHHAATKTSAYARSPRSQLNASLRGIYGYYFLRHRLRCGKALLSAHTMHFDRTPRSDGPDIMRSGKLLYSKISYIDHLFGTILESYSVGRSLVVRLKIGRVQINIKDNKCIGDDMRNIRSPNPKLY